MNQVEREELLIRLGKLKAIPMLTKNFKGEHGWEVKVYGDSSTPEGLLSMENRTKELKERANQAIRS